jgi:4-amino-4-deoxy-L-arabinose transferase-like glycosyltransferase
MLGSGLHGWIVPHLNGKIRLEKPPLAYWLAAGSFKLFGVGPAAGRLPFAILGWLTVGLTYAIGRDLFNRVVGVTGAAALLAGFLFFRHARLAETDGPATLFVTAATWWMWRGLASRDGAFLRLNLSAAAIALGLLSKQGAVVYPLVFLIFWTVAERRWSALGRWVISGAPLTLLVVGGTWFFVTGRMLGWRVFWHELKDVTSGRDHPAIFLIYVPMLLQAAAPWIAVTVVALVASMRRWLNDERLRFVLLWAASILVPLCFAGNKQSHYLMPMMPPLALLSGWIVERAMRAERDERAETLSPGEHGTLRAVVRITLVLGLVAAGAVFFIGAKQRGGISLEDVILSGALLLITAWAIAVAVRKPAAAALLGFCATGAVMPYVTGRWLPSLQRHDHRAFVAHLRHRLPPGTRYCFYGGNESVPLTFGLRQIMPQYQHEDELRTAIARDPHVVVLAQFKNGVAPPPVPRPLEQIFEDRLEDQRIRVYRMPHKPAPGAAATTSPASRATPSPSRRPGSTRGSASRPRP